jgi:hypothetical protein
LLHEHINRFTVKKTKFLPGASKQIDLELHARKTKHNVTWHPKAGMAESEKTVIARKRLVETRCRNNELSYTCIHDRIVRKALEIELHPNNMNTAGFFLSKTRKPLICSLKEPPGHDAGSTSLRRSMNALQLNPEATGSMLSR